MNSILRRSLPTLALIGLMTAITLLTMQGAYAHALIGSGTFRSIEQKPSQLGMDGIVHQAKSRPGSSFNSAAKRPPQARPNQKLRKPLTTNRSSVGVRSKLPNNARITVSGRAGGKYLISSGNTTGRKIQQRLLQARTHNATKKLASLRNSFAKTANQNLGLSRKAVFLKNYPYNDGSRTTMEHILKQHGHNSISVGKGKFAIHMSPLRIRSAVRLAIKKGVYTHQKDGSIRIRHTLETSQPVGKNQQNIDSKRIEVIIRDGGVRSAFPI